MPDYATSAPTPAASSRIDAEIDRIKTLINNVRYQRERVVRHAHALGFYPPEKSALSGVNTGPLAPVVTSLYEANSELSQEIDNLSAALNVFD